MVQNRKLNEFTKEEYEEFFAWLFDNQDVCLEKEVDISKCLEYQEPYIYYTPEIKAFFETKPMRRLGRIGQLANCSMNNPNASHTRLTHCKGAYQKLLEFYMLQYKKSSWREKNSDEESRLKVLADMMDMASHDIGHNVCSHALEKLISSCKGAHEILGDRILHENAEVVNAFNNIHPKLLQTLDLVKKEDYNLHTLKEGNIDFDRADFLIRDSLYLGVENGFANIKEYPRTITNLLDQIMNGCEIYKINRDGKDIEVPVFSYQVEPEIEELLERRAENYEYIYCSKINKPKDVILSNFCNILMKDEYENSDLKYFLKHISESKIESIDLDTFLEWDDIRFFNSLFEIINNSNNIDLKKSATACLPKLDSLISVVYGRIMPYITPSIDEKGNEINIENEFNSEEDKKFYKNIKRLVKDKVAYEKFMENSIISDDIINISFDNEAEQEAFKQQLEKGFAISETETISFSKENIEKLKFWKYKINKYNKSEPIFIKSDDNKIYTLDEYPERKSDFLEKSQYGLIIIEPMLKNEGFDNLKFQKLKEILNFNRVSELSEKLDTQSTRLNSELKDIELKIIEADEK